MCQVLFSALYTQGLNPPNPGGWYSHPPILQINGGSERSFIRDSKAGKGEAMKSNPRAWPSTSM